MSTPASEARRSWPAEAGSGVSPSAPRRRSAELIEGDLVRVLERVLPDEIAIAPEVAVDTLHLDSVQATRLVMEIRLDLGVEVPLTWLGSNDTVARLARRIAELAGSAVPSGAADGELQATGQAPDPGHTLGSDLPLTPLQQAYSMGKRDDLTDDPVGCHVYRELEVENLDPRRLEEAWRRLVAHHAALRLVVTPEGCQRVVEPPEQWRLTVHQVTDGGADAFAARRLEVRRRLTCRSYPPGDWPPFSLEVTLGVDRPSIVHLDLDAMVVDAHGLELLVEHLGRCYRRPDWVPPRGEMPLEDCLRALAAPGDPATRRRDLDYWRSRLEGMPRWPLPSPDDTFGGEPWGRRRVLQGSLSKNQSRGLRARAAALDVSPTSLVLTLFCEGLNHRISGGSYPLVITTNGRLRLPGAAEHTVGPFTSTLVFTVEDTGDHPLDEAARQVHQSLWRDLAHASIGGVTVLRELDRGAPWDRRTKLPVVFTSLLENRDPGKQPRPWARTVHGCSRTSGVRLDHQVWEEDGEVRIRWDVVAGAFPVGMVDSAFAALLNGLAMVSLAPAAVPTRALNELQKAYFVARRQPLAEGDSCLVYHAFHVDHLDRDRLAVAWARLVDAYDPLRAILSHDGELHLAESGVDRWHLPVIETGDADPEARCRALREDMMGRAFALGRGPHVELRVTSRPGGTSTVHCAIDLALLDGRSIHWLLRQLFLLYSEPRSLPRPALPLTEHLARQATRDLGSELVWWQRRFESLPPGPRWAAGPGDSCRRRRLEHRWSGWRFFEQRATELGLEPDLLLLAALGEAFAGSCDSPFTVPVVRWTPETEDFRPDELTTLSWVVRSSRERSLLAWADEYRRQIEAEPRGAGVEGLEMLRRQVLRRRRDGDFALGVVYTSLLDLRDLELPAGCRAGSWATSTPDVSLDSIAVVEGDGLCCIWDAVDTDFAADLLDTLFARFRALVDRLFDATDTEWAGGLRREMPEEAVSESSSAMGLPAHRAFEARARERPGAIALRARDGTMTYRELNRRANRIARRLLDLGLGAEIPIGIRVPRGFDLVAAVLAVHKVGGAYVPIEPDWPTDRAVKILDQVGAPVLLTTTTVRSEPMPSNLRRLDLDSAELASSAQATLAAATEDPLDLDPDPGTGAANTAYILFTSGSTGEPKGVAVAHHSITGLLDWCWERFDFAPSDIGLCVTSLGFDLSVFDIFGLLGRGASLYLADEEERKDPELLLDILLREGITFWNSAPTTLAQLAPFFDEKAGSKGREQLRLVFLSGDFTPLSLPGALRGLFPCARLVSLGGATEATVWSNFFEVGAVDPEWRSIPYGVPIPGARYYVLKPDLSPCPDGREGDLFIAGACLSLGYRGRPGLTAGSFVPDPFAPAPGQRMYRTGDRVKTLADGTLTILGRSDNQVKIRGHRVELGEIEHRLRQHPAVEEVVVLARRSPDGDSKLIAYVVACSPRPTPGELRGLAAQTLPGYMVPNFVVFLSTFPATSNGKLDRDALPPPSSTDSEGGATEGVREAVDTHTDPPAGPGQTSAAAHGPGECAVGIAAEIANAVAELLGLSEIDPEQDLWDQGATSFTMVQVAALLKRRYSQRLPISSLVSEPTAAGIARRIARGLVPEEVPTPEKAPAPDRSAAGTSPQAAAAVPPDATGPTAVDFFDPASRRAFRRGQWNLRCPTDEGRLLHLPHRTPADEHYAWRSTRREYTPGPVPAESLHRLLGLLAEARVRDDRAHRLYPSAGETYAVQTYLHVKPGGIEGVPAGCYHYHPDRHALEPLGTDGEIDRGLHFSYNRPIFDRAAFGLYLIGQRQGIEPLYGEDGERFLLLEAGYMGQLLMMGQAACGLGLCPIGSLAFERLRVPLGLDGGHCFLHAFLGGPASHPTQIAATGEGPALAPGGRPPAVEVGVVGLAGAFPGAPDSATLWRNLCRGECSLGPLPASRQERRGSTVGGTGCAIDGGYLPRIDRFDSLRFRISPQEAATLDPQVLLLLETVAECLETAGHSADSLSHLAPRVGVFVGSMWHDQQHLGADRWRNGGVAEISAVGSEIPNRISHALGFRGPSLAIDTGCSSSLTALHLAVESLRRGECDAALVGACNLLSHPYHLEVLAGLGLVGRHASDAAFDQDASGWSPGEGAVALLLMPAELAERQDSEVFGWIEATEIGHLGGGGRFTAPDAEGLRRSISHLLAKAELTPRDIGYVECAASGASLADAAEMEALGQVFGRVESGPTVRFGTLKPNIGHLEAASGLSQVSKVLLQMHHRQIAPTRLASDPNPLVSWRSSALRPADRLEAWEPSRPGEPLRALVNALGATGSHAHVVLRSTPLPTPGTTPGTAPTDGSGEESSGRRTESADQGISWHGSAADLEGGVVQRIEEHLLELYSEVSGIPRSRLSPEVRFDEYGLTSLQISRLNTRLERDFRERSRTLFYEHQHLAAVASALAGRGVTWPPSTSAIPRGLPRGGGEVSARPRRADATRTDGGGLPSSASEDIAIVGIAGRYPGAPDLEQFWRNLEAGRDGVTAPPPERCLSGWLDQDLRGGFLTEIDAFDPLFFGITPRDAGLMDPQERLFLEVVWETLEDAGIPPSALRRRCDNRVSVHVGAMYNEYPFFGVERSLGGEPVASGSALAGIANRVSYFLDLEGPSLTVDTMCSSSLTALHLAVEALRRGESEMALVGGVNLSLHRNKFVQQEALGMRSSDHRCRSFGAGGDGFVPGEGVGAVLLVPLSSALDHGDRIQAVIKGTAINHGGRARGYMVPNPVAQGKLVGEALRRAGVEPAGLDYLEAHGTGTALGDPIEINGLLRAFAGSQVEPGSCALGSVKSNIGHLEAAAGIAGLTKVVLQMTHQTLVPSLHSRELHPDIDWASSPFRVQRQLRDWPRRPAAQRPRRAGISSFGAGGANAHVVLESFDPPIDEPEPESREPQLVVLSARDEGALGALCGRLVSWLERHRDPSVSAPSLADIAFTLQVGRQALRQRLALVVDAIEPLVDRLQRFGAGEMREVVSGRASEVPDRRVPTPPLSPDPTRDSLLAVGRFWVAGGEVDWALLHPGRGRRRLALPHYPFERRRCWLADPDSDSAAVGGPAAAEGRETVGVGSSADPEGPGQPPWASLFHKTWLEDPSPTSVDPGVDLGIDLEGDRGRVVCWVGEGSRALGRRLADRLGADRVVLCGDLEPRSGRDDTCRFQRVEEVREALERGDLTGWIDLYDLGPRQHDPVPWTTRLDLLQQLLRRKRGGVRLLHVVRGLQPMPGPEPSLAGARMAGFVRMLGAEMDGVCSTVVDLDGGDDPAAEVDGLLGEWLRCEGVNEVCLRRGRRYRPLWRPLPLEPQTPPTLSADHFYLVTGGTRGLGALVARHLARRGARRLALCGARPVPPRHRRQDAEGSAARESLPALVEELEAEGVEVALAGGGLLDEGLPGFLDRLREDSAGLAGVIHAAGRSSLGPSAFVHKRGDEIERVSEPKVAGLERLATLCRGDRLDFFLLFSSISAVVPELGVGVSDYAAANAFMDFYAAHRQHRDGTDMLSIAWPRWRRRGEGEGPTARGGIAGLDSISEDEGIALLDRLLLGIGPTQVAVAPALDNGFDPSTWVLGRRAARAPQPVPGVVAPEVGPIVASVGAPSVGASEAVDVEPPPWLRRLFADSLELAEHEIEATVPFADLGVESVLLAELLQGIEHHLDRRLEPTVLLEHDTLARLASHLEASGTSASTSPETEPRRSAAVSSGRPVDRRVAVVGMAGRLPGAPDLDTFWANLTAGKCSIGEIPSTRWNGEELYHPDPGPGRSSSKWGGFVEAGEDFDATFFGLGDEQALFLDPAIRWLLESSVTCLRDAGYEDRDVAGRDIGVFVGARASDYRHRGGPRSAEAGLGGDQNFMAARVAHQLDLHGPNLVVDAACASSLVAVQLACRSVLEGESEMALAGGAEVLVDAQPYLQFTVARALSPTGRCRTFDRDADGFVPGEGCGLLLLKPLARALEDGDRIQAVIEAVAVNNDGRTMGLTTPNPRAQAEVVRRALAASGLAADQIGLVEAHGTATRIGDPIELRALTEAFRHTSKRRGYCAIGSVKSNIGHLLSAAGIAGLLKVILALKHATLPPTLFCDHPNPRFDLAASPFYPNTELRPWSGPGSLRAAGVSAFGLGGTNAHLVATAFESQAHRVRRSPLPPPVFHRRRFWLTARGSGSSENHGVVPEEPGSSLLDLHFADQDGVDRVGVDQDGVDRDGGVTTEATTGALTEVTAGVAPEVSP